MTSNDRTTAELLASLCDETISAEEMQRLDRLICADAAVRRLYVEYLDLHARLSYQFHQPSESGLPLPAEQSGSELSGQPFAVGDPAPFGGDSPAAVPFPPIIVQSPAGLPLSVSPLLSPMGSFVLSYSLAAVIVGIGLLIGWVCQVSTSQQVAHDDPRPAATPLGHESEMVFVGRVTGIVECRWADPKTGTFDYASVPLGRKYALASGLMEITYDTGARVILQGPCVYKVESATGGFLLQGKVTALVEKKAEDGKRNAEAQKTDKSDVLTPSPALFAIRTPTALVTDLGTEFGVEVDKSGTTKSHVFQGRVVLMALEGGQKQEHGKITLTANESARIDREPGSRTLSVRRHKVDAVSFVRSAQFAVKAKEIGEAPLRPFRAWQAASERLRQRDGLLAYYDFQRDPDHPRDQSGYELLRNRAASGAKFDGRVRGAIRMGMAQGRFPGKDALRFAYPADGVRINIPGEFPQLTLVTSLNLERCDGLSSILMTDRWDRGDHFHWQFCAGGFIKFATPSTHADFLLEAREAADFCAWHVWSLVYDGPGRRMTTYVDGRPLKQWTLSKGPALKIGEATIGNWDPRENDALRPLCGRMDEFAIFARALSEAEIKQFSENASGIQFTQQQKARNGSSRHP